MLVHIMFIVFARMEEDSMEVGIQTVSVSELLEFTDRNLMKEILYKLFRVLFMR